MRIAYIRRLENDWTDSRFLLERDGIEMIQALLDGISWRDSVPFTHDNHSLEDVDIMFFRAIGRKYDQANRLISYAMANRISVYDSYLYFNGAGPRGKISMYNSLLEDNILCPGHRTWFTFNGPESIREYSPRDNFPYIMKTDLGGRQGKNTWLIKRDGDIEKLASLLSTRAGSEKWAKFMPKNGVRIDVENYFENDGDYRVMVSCGEALGCIKRGRKKRKIIQDASVGESRFIRDDEVEDLAVEAANSMGVQFAGVDIIATDLGLMVIEVNEAPSFRAFEAKSGIDVAGRFLEKLRELHG